MSRIEAGDMPSILAIDLALSRTGLAGSVAEGGGHSPWASTFDTGRLAGHDRESAIIYEIDTAVRVYRPDVVMLEDIYVPAVGKLGAGYLGLAFLHGVVRFYLRGRAPLLVVHNTHVKIFATGDGGAGKQDVMLAVERGYGHLVAVSDDNQADAFAMLAMGCYYYGHPLRTMADKKLPETHLRALSKVVGWPSLNGSAPGTPVGPAAPSRRSGRAKAVGA
jgi:Holliday junction resolvasome RuvABC endonuclease subunit